MEYENEFDIITLIYCDFGVLPLQKRVSLLKKIFNALKSGGIFIFDVFTIKQYETLQDTLTTSFEESGFWRAEPYVCLKKDKCYDNNIFLEQYTIVTENEIQYYYNLWNHAFTQDELEQALLEVGFSSCKFYGGVAGEAIDKNSKTYCIVCEKA